MSRQARRTGIPYLRLSARTDWRSAGPGVGKHLLEKDGRLELGDPTRRPISTTEPFGTFGGRTLPRGLALSGADGRIFLADPDRRVILTWQIGAPSQEAGPMAPFGPLWPARPLQTPDGPRPDRAPVDPYVLVRPTDVALSPTGDLVIADPGAGRLLVLAYPTARLRHVITLPGWQPTSLAFDHAGRAYVADPAGDTVHRFWPNWRLDPRFPHPSAGLVAPEHVACVPGPRRKLVCGPCGDVDPDAGPAVLVIDRSGVVGLSDRGLRGPMNQLPELEPGPLRRDREDNLRYDDRDLPRSAPLVIRGLALTRDGRHVGSGLPLLAVPAKLVRPQSATFATAALDGGRPSFVWDRLVLRGEIPEGTRLLVSTRTDDSPLEAHRLAQADGWAPGLTIEQDDVPELLVQSPPGRYLWLRIELFGDGRATPSIAGIDVFGPRSSSVHHLPAAFHQDPESLRFLDRFLAYFDTVFGEITAEHREVAALLDPSAAPAGPALDWLGSWFDLDFLAEWSPALRRRMIAEAMAYARERGTIHGLRRVLQWHTGLADPLPQIIEHFRVPDGDHYVGGELLDATPAAHGCTVVLPHRVAPDAAAQARLERLVAAHLPGHVHARVLFVHAGVAVGRASTVGVDTLLGTPSDRSLGSARLGLDLTTARGPRSAVTLHSLSHHGDSHDQ